MRKFCSRLYSSSYLSPKIKYWSGAQKRVQPLERKEPPPTTFLAKKTIKVTKIINGHLIAARFLLVRPLFLDSPRYSFIHFLRILLIVNFAEDRVHSNHLRDVLFPDTPSEIYLFNRHTS